MIVRDPETEKRSSNNAELLSFMIRGKIMSCFFKQLLFYYTRAALSNDLF